MILWLVGMKNAIFFFKILTYGSERLLLVVDKAGETKRKGKEGLICVIWFWKMKD